MKFRARMPFVQQGEDVVLNRLDSRGHEEASGFLEGWYVF